MFDHYFTVSARDDVSKIDRLETFYQRNHSPVLLLLLAALVVSIVWASFFHIDQVARAGGEVIASSRVQIIQAVDGGVLAAINVREGDRVEPGQTLALLDTARATAAVKEIDARVSALQAKATRLRAEVTGQETLVFSEDVLRFPELVRVERALFEQRRTGLSEELRTLRVAVGLAQEEAKLVQDLSASGDVNRSEVIRAERALNDAEAKLINVRNRYLEDARLEVIDLLQRVFYRAEGIAA